jgi:hypothetical protein
MQSAQLAALVFCAEFPWKSQLYAEDWSQAGPVLVKRDWYWWTVPKNSALGELVKVWPDQNEDRQLRARTIT